jgi:hypothetical protein
VEKKSVTPKMVQDLLKKMEDYSYLGFYVNSISGSVEGDTFTARGSGQKYALKPNDELRKLLAAGKSKVTLSGELTQKDQALTLEVASAKECAK